MSSELKVGDRAPSFNLESDAGEKITLKDFKGQKVVLYFYPKDLTTGCTKQACDFKASIKKFRSKNAVILGISRDPIELHQRFKAKYKLPFHLLSDSEGDVTQEYGVWQEKSMYGRKYMGIVRTTFIIDEKGKIAHIFPKVKVSNHIEEVLSEL